MKECRHHLDPDACELCQEHIRAVAARRRKGPGRPLTLSDERRAEIARIAEQRRWSNLHWSKPYRPHSKEHREKLAAVARGRWAAADTKSNRVRAALIADPNKRTSEIAREMETSTSFVSNTRTRLGLPRQKREKHEPISLTRADLEADVEKTNRYRSILAYVKRGYRGPRIAQLLDLPLDEVKLYIAAVKDPTVSTRRVLKSRPMTEEDLSKAYGMWKEGMSVKSIASKLDRDYTQVSTALRKLLRAIGEK